jgi:serine/threonine-protein kinase
VTATTARRGGGVSLGTRIFLITALLIVLAVGAAVVLTFVLGNRIAAGAVKGALDRSAAAQKSLQQQYEAQLQRMAATFSDQYLVGYLAEALGTQDAESILDLLRERQREIGFNFAIALDSTGRVVARTDRRTGGGQNLGGQPMVRKAADTGEAQVGLWVQEEGLYNAVAVPLVVPIGDNQFDFGGCQVSGF